MFDLNACVCEVFWLYQRMFTLVRPVQFYNDNLVGFEHDEGDFTAIRTTAIYKCKLAPLHCVKLEENREKNYANLYPFKPTYILNVHLYFRVRTGSNIIKFEINAQNVVSTY